MPVTANGGAGSVRAAELVASLGAVRRGIADAASAAGRDPRTVTLIAVTKTFPADDVAVLAALGQLDVGENRDQEARAKIEQLRDAERPVAGLRWHLVGQLQTNKARSVVGYAHAVHSVDRSRLVGALGDAVERAGRPDPLPVFVQVSLDDDPARGGAPVAEVPGLADGVAAHPGLRLAGVMAVAPMGLDPEAAFARLAEVSQRLQAGHPGAAGISAGMSGDYPVAVRYGATHVRIGSALLGRRGPDVG